ncbi:MAG: hypothetical protein RIB65_11225 [Ilumatobacter fluminis]
MFDTTKLQGEYESVVFPHESQAFGTNSSMSRRVSSELAHAPH